MQKQPFKQYHPYTLSTNFPLVATLGCCFLHPYHPNAVFSFHDCIELFYCHSGKGILISENQRFPFQAGDVVFLSPYMSHYFYKEGAHSCRYETIHVNLAKMHDSEIFPDVIDLMDKLSIPFSIPPVISRERFPVFGEIVKNMLLELSCCRPYFEMSIRGYCLSVVSMLSLLYSESLASIEEKQPDRSLYPALLAMNRNFSEDFSIPELASLCGLSETHFRRLFKNMFSMSPLDYLNHIRIQESCFLLNRRSLLIAEAAKQSGFRTLSSYNRKFQEVMQVSPTEWMKKRLDQQKNPYILYYG